MSVKSRKKRRDGSDAEPPLVLFLIRVFSPDYKDLPKVAVSGCVQTGSLQNCHSDAIGGDGVLRSTVSAGCLEVEEEATPVPLFH